MTTRKGKDKGRHDTDARNTVGVSKKIEELRQQKLNLCQEEKNLIG